MSGCSLWPGQEAPLTPADVLASSGIWFGGWVTPALLHNALLKGTPLFAVCLPGAAGVGGHGDFICLGCEALAGDLVSLHVPCEQGMET